MKSYAVYDTKNYKFDILNSVLNNLKYFENHAPGVGFNKVEGIIKEDLKNVWKAN